MLEEAAASRDAVVRQLDETAIVQASWAFGNSGTRFNVFRQPGCARDVTEKIADAGLVHRLTGAAGALATILPWDQAQGGDEVAAQLAQVGLAAGPVRTNLFQDEAYRLGTLCHHDPAVRQLAVDHVLACISFAQQVGSTTVGVWLPD